jgi:hypothetical protein
MRKLLKLLAAVAILYVVYFFTERTLVLRWIHGWVQDHLGDLTGADQTVAWLVALALLALSRLVRWRQWLLAPLTGGAKSVLAFAAICLAAAGALKFTSARMLFDSSGNPRQSWIETTDGPITLDAPPGGIDAKTGLLRKPLDAETLRAIKIGKTTNGNAANSDPNRYFNARDGKYKVWFVAGTCQTRDAEGYDDRGRKLLPATPELVDSCERLHAEAEQQRRSDAERQSRRQLLEQQKTRQHEFQEIGTYTAAGRYTVIDGTKLAFEECVVLRRETRLKFRLARLGADAESGGTTKGRFEFSLLNSDGTETRSTSLRRVQGMVTVASDSAGLLPQDPGESGWVVVEFQRDSESGGFAIAINHAVAFSNPAGHIVAFRRF